jgi:hypothetical protein
VVIDKLKQIFSENNERLFEFLVKTLLQDNIKFKRDLLDSREQDVIKIKGFFDSKSIKLSNNLSRLYIGNSRNSPNSYIYIDDEWISLKELNKRLYGDN